MFPAVTEFVNPTNVGIVTPRAGICSCSTGITGIFTCTCAATNVVGVTPTVPVLASTNVCTRVFDPATGLFAYVCSTQGGVSSVDVRNI